MKFHFFIFTVICTFLCTSCFSKKNKEAEPISNREAEDSKIALNKCFENKFYESRENINSISSVEVMRLYFLCNPNGDSETFIAFINFYELDSSHSLSKLKFKNLK